MNKQAKLYQAPNIKTFNVFPTAPLLVSGDITDGISLGNLTEVEEEW